MQMLIDKLRQIINISDEEAELIKQLFTEKKIKKGEFFLREGQVCRSVGVIGIGLVRYYIKMMAMKALIILAKRAILYVIMKAFFHRRLLTKISRHWRTV